MLNTQTDFSKQNMNNSIQFTHVSNNFPESTVAECIDAKLPANLIFTLAPSTPIDNEIETVDLAEQMRITRDNMLRIGANRKVG